MALLLTSNTRIINQRTLEIEVCRIFLIQHLSANVRHISSRIRLASHVDLVILNSEQLLPILEELDEILRYVDLVLSFDFAGCKTCADRLFDPSNLDND